MSSPILSLLLPALLGATATAQCLAVATSNAGGNTQNGTMFDVVNTSTTALTVASFEQRFGVTGTVTVEVYTRSGSYFGSETIAANWTLVGTTPVDAVFGAGPTPIPLAINVSIAPGATQGFYVTTTNSTVVYTSGIAQLNTVIGSDANLQVVCGVGSGYPFGAGGTYGLPADGRIWNGRVLYSQGGGCQKAVTTVLGSSCFAATYNSFYQRFADATQSAPALTGNSLELINTGSGYIGAWSAGTAAADFVAPVAASVLATADDGTVAVTPSTPFLSPFGSQATLLVSGNGIVGFGAAGMNYPGTNAFTPTAGGFLDSALGGFYVWHDFNPAEAGSGPVLAEEVGGVLYITYDGVENYPSGVVNRSTVQLQLELTTGNCRMVFVDIDGNATSAFGSAMLVGVSAPGASLDPGSVDLAVVSPQSVFPELPAITLAATSVPVAGTAWGLQIRDIAPTAVIGVTVFGASDAAIGDLSFLGMPGCGLRASLDSLSAFPVTGATHDYSLPIPNNPGFLGASIFSTSALFLVPPTNAFGAVTTNGIQGTIGNY